MKVLLQHVLSVFKKILITQFQQSGDYVSNSIYQLYGGSQCHNTTFYKIQQYFRKQVVHFNNEPELCLLLVTFNAIIRLKIIQLDVLLDCRLPEKLFVSLCISKWSSSNI